MMCLMNFFFINLDVLEKVVEIEGQLFVDGLENFICDLEENNGELIVKFVDEKVFELGGNVVIIEGVVVYCNEMMEFIQFLFSIDEVYEILLVIFLLWINKYYIFDLKEKNSLIKWIVDQGYIVFIVSWLNLDLSYVEIGMEDYIQDGYLCVIEEVKFIMD